MSSDVRNRIRTLLLGLTTAAAAIALTGCATSAPADDASGTPSPSTSASAEPAVATVRIGAADVKLLDADGTELTALPYTSTADDLVAAYTDAFGVEPTEEAYPGHIEEQPGTDYVWESFTLRVLEPNASVPDQNLVNYVVTAAKVGDIAITAGADDVTVGATVADVVPGPGSSADPVDIDGVPTRFHAADVHEIGGTDDFGNPLADYVSARVGPDGVVTELYALNHSYGV